MTPDSIILLTPDSRLDALLYALEGARKRFYAEGAHNGPSSNWDAWGAAWEALHAELMSQLKKT